ncbi:hypothetical protein GCM10028804_29260 [Larkinella terrae]
MHSAKFRLLQEKVLVGNGYSLIEHEGIFRISTIVDLSPKNWTKVIGPTELPAQFVYRRSEVC